MTVKNFTVSELVNSLRHSNLPTVVVEGKDNANMIERLIKRRGSTELDRTKKVNVLLVSNRNVLISFYNRRYEFTIPVVFIANRDMWLYTRVPRLYQDIIFTQGYSLENDIYKGAGLENLLEPHERWEYHQVLNSTIEWFAFEVEEYRAGKRKRVNFRLKDIIPPGQAELDTNFCKQQGFHRPNPETVQQIRNDHQFRLPGRLLFDILRRILNTSGRSFKFQITPRGLYEIALMMCASPPLLKGLMSEVRKKIDREEARINLAPLGHAPERQRELKIKVGNKINATILKKDGIKVTVQLQTDNNEEIIFESPYYPGQVGDTAKLKVMDLDSTGKVSKVIP